MSNSQGFLDVFFHGFMLGAKEVIQPATRERRSRLKFDSTVVCPVRRQRWGGVLTEYRSRGTEYRSGGSGMDWGADKTGGRAECRQLE
jgi:hypothetical protein